MNKNKLRILSLALLLPMMASCQGGESSSSGSAGPEPEAKLSFKEAEGQFNFPTVTEFTDDVDSLPALGAKEFVAFVPVSTNYSKCWAWLSDGTNTNLTGGVWPGVDLATKYNDQWLKIGFDGYDEVNIIFSINGGAQTADMKMTHPGYWWFWQSDNNIHDETPITTWLDSASFIDGDTIQVVGSKKITKFELYEGEEKILEGIPTTNAIDIEFGSRPWDIEKGYSVTATLEGYEPKFSKTVAIQKLYKEDSFNAKYAYDGNDLGVTYTTSKSTFKVWSPFSSEINVKIYENGTPVSVDASKGSDQVYKTVAMSKGEKGVWTAEVAENLAGKYYTYEVTNETYEKKEVVDPYARSAGVNGLRGMILDLASTNPEGWDQIAPKPYDRKELTVWECHIADMSSSSTWNGTEANRKKYAGFHEAGTTYTEDEVTVKTGFDHVKELGVNAVQILPFFDQANDEVNVSFNWGYNPLNYNVPEGGYSSNPFDGAVRVKEVKELIADYNKAGINIIMDVVYNHMGSAIGSNFDVLFPGYFFRYNGQGALSNGSGCGNETASNHQMFRKFMIDSCVYWAKEYKLGGFRFDLMGLHDVETMKQLTAACKAVNPNIVIYGEPWAGGTSTGDYVAANQKNGKEYVGYGQFNDGMRDALIKGGLNEATTKGWGTDLVDAHTADVATISAGIKGTTLSDGTIADPDKTVNYVTCHDNYTIYDRIAFNWGAGNYKSFIKNMAISSQSFVFTSQGTSFMLAGDEFLRTKGGNHNSYGGDPLNVTLRSKGYTDWYGVNELDYSLKVQNLGLVEVMKKLIALKKNVDGLHLGAEEAAKMEITSSQNGNMISYEVKDSKANKTYKIVHQATWPLQRKDGQLVIKDPTLADFTGYSELYLSTLRDEVTLTSATALEPGETIIAVK